MLTPALRRLTRAWAERLWRAGFWEWLAGLLLLALLIGTMLVVAVHRHDAFLRLQPLVCPEGLADRPFFVAAMAAPVSVLLALAAVGELWGQMERHRAGLPVRWFHLLLFGGLASGLAVLVLFALGC